MKNILQFIFLLFTIGLSAQDLSPEVKDAITTNDISSLKNIPEQNKINECYEKNGKTYDLLATCIQANATQVLKYLLEKGFDPNASCVDKSPLMYAAKYGKKEAAQILLENGADLKMVRNGKTALDYAIKYNQDELKSYLNSLGASIKTLDGVDGPYIFGDDQFTVNSENKVVQQKIGENKLVQVKVDNKDKDQFLVRLKSTHRPEKDTYPLPQKLLAISDIEGNFDGFYSFLFNNKIIDKQCNWIFGDGHLVLVGDFVDRGENVTQVLWLIYGLEEKAKKDGGKVHFILGNHEHMNMEGDTRYVVDKYLALAKNIKADATPKAAYQYLFSEESEIGKWLRSKNVIEKIGGYLFVHAGLSPDLLNYDLSTKKINQITRKNFDLYSSDAIPKDSTAMFLLEGKGPLWYRGLVQDRSKYNKITASELDQVLNYYNAQKIVIGHTVVDDISTDFDGKIIRIDLKHGHEKNTGLTKGLLIENGVEYKINDLGKREKL